MIVTLAQERIYELNSTPRGELAPLPSPGPLQEALAIAQDLFPEAFVMAVARHGQLHLEANAPEDWRHWYRLEPTTQDLVATRLSNVVEAAGYDTSRWVPLAGWADAQAWRSSPAPGADSDLPEQGSAISTHLHIGEAQVVVVRTNSCFSLLEARRFTLDVGLFDPDPWRYGFIHRAAEVLGIGGTNIDCHLEPGSVRDVLKLASDEERRMPGHIAFNAMRKRWYAELLAIVRSCAESGEITMSDEEIDGYAEPGSFDESLADGMTPDEAFASDRSYWD